MSKHFILPLVLLAACELPAHVARDSQTIDGDIRAVRIDVDGGEVTIEQSGSAVELDRVARYRGDEPSTRVEVIDGVLEIAARCRDCSVDHALRLPEGVPVEVVTGAGDIDIEGMDWVDAATSAGRIELRDIAGDSDLYTAAGDIVVDRLDGLLVGHTNAGDITVSGLVGDRAELSSRAGDLTVEVAVTPQEVWLETQAGRVDLELPAGVYDVEATAVAGDVRVDNLTQDASAERWVRAHSDAGDVVIHGY